MNQNLIFGILFLKTLFWKYNFFIFVQTCQWTSSLISGLLAESLKAKKITHFIIQFYSKNLTHFTNLNSHWTFLSLQFFEEMCFCLVSKKKAAPFFEAQELHSWSEANVCMFLYISVRKCLFHRRSKILFGGLGWGEIELFI